MSLSGELQEVKETGEGWENRDNQSVGGKFSSGRLYGKVQFYTDSYYINGHCSFCFLFFLLLCLKRRLYISCAEILGFVYFLLVMVETGENLELRCWSPPFPILDTRE